MNKLKPILLGLLLAYQTRADYINPQIYLDSNTNVVVNSTVPERKYSVLEKTCLTDPWSEIAAPERGTGSNLVIAVDSSTPTKFFKVRGDYEPIEPTFITFGCSTCQTPVYPPVVVNYNIHNYLTNNVDVNVTFVEDITVGGYIANTPFNQTLTNGNNTVTFIMDLLGHEGSTVFTYGNINIKQIQ